MSTAGPSSEAHAKEKPSVFLSYASEDRPAARRLRDALDQAGLDVWYDENELGGGDAWDQKIRRQIRECTYFVAVISATTDQRSEGYFRREWRLAVERTLDMADDVLFLVPIVIDETHEEGARVPEKFLAVQWVRVPGGGANAALEAVTRRLLVARAAPEPTRPRAPRAHAGPRTPVASSAPPPELPPSADAEDSAPPAMPPFPHPPKQGDLHLFRFLAEVIWWAVTAVWLIVRRLPRWLRIFLGVWFVITLFSRCDGDNTPSPPATRIRSENTPGSPAKPDAALEKPDGAQEIKTALQAAANELRKESAQAPGSSLAANLTRIGAEIAAGVAKGIPDAPGTPVQVAVAAFASDGGEGPGHDFGRRLRTALLAELAKAPASETGVSTRIAPSELSPAEAGRTDPELVLLARERGLRFVLRATSGSQGGSTDLTLRLIATSDGRTAWTQTVTSITDAAAIEILASDLARAMRSAINPTGAPAAIPAPEPSRGSAPP